MDPANNSCEDFDEDEELRELRSAALATLKSNSDAKIPEIESSSLPDVVTSVPSTYSSSHYPNDPTTHYARRNSTQPPRRGGGRGRPFPKVNQRSNLIVITPVNLGEKLEESKEAPAPQLVLPQHKWCHAVNEDSSSPQIYRRTGPTRFNRHESRSDSSDSDYENSDNDSYSNETILQDEPSDHFARLTPEDRMGRGGLHRQQSVEQRLSFQNIDSNLNSVPKDDTGGKLESLSSVSKETDSDRNYNQYNPLVNSSQAICTSNSDEAPTSTSINGECHSKRDFLASCVTSQVDSTKAKKGVDEDSSVNGSGKVRRSYVNRNRLSDTDLRLELKKRMQKFKSSDGPVEQKECGVQESVAHGVDCRQSHTLECSGMQTLTRGSEIAERQIQTSIRKRIEAPSYSPPQNHRDRVSKRNLDCGTSYSKDKECSSADKGRRRDRCQSSSTGAKQDYSASRHTFDRNHKGSSRRSPDRVQKRVSNHHSHGSNKNHKENQSSTKKGRGGSSGEENRRRHSSSSSSTSSSGSSSTSNSSGSSRMQFRSVPSVIQSVIRPTDKTLNVGGSSGEKRASSETDFISPKRGKSSDEIGSSLASSIRTPNYGGGENRNNASDGSKRMPVHMRLGTLPRKQIIQMTKDVESAFVNTSTDDDDEEESNFRVRGKKQNFRVVTELCGNKMDDVSMRHIEKGSFKSVDVSRDKARRTEVHR